MIGKKVFIVVTALLVSSAILYNYSHLMSRDPFEKVVFSNINTAKTDSFGDTYVVDSGKTRIVKRNAEGYAEYIIYGRGKDTSATFFDASDISVEDEDYFYVHDVIWDATGLKIKTERILEFSKENGRAERVLYIVDRTEDDASAPGSSYLQALSGLTCGGGKIWFAKKDVNGYAVMSLALKEGKTVRKGEIPAAVKEYECVYEDAAKKIFDFSIDPVKRNTYYVDKAGSISISAPEDARSIFVPVSGNRVSEFSLPFRISFDGSDLYFTDIGKRAIFRVDNEGRARIVMGGWSGGGSSWPPVYNSIYARGGMLTLTSLESVVVKNLADESEKFNISSLPVSLAVIVQRTGLEAVFAVFIVSALIALKMLFSYLLRRKLSQKESIGFLIVAAAFLLFFSIAPSILGTLRSDVKNETLNNLSYIMQISPEILDSESFAAIENPQDYDSPAYRKFTQSLNALVSRKYNWNENKYGVAYKFKDNVLYVTAFLDESIGAFSSPVMFEGSDAQEIARGGTWITDMDLKDVSGTYISLTGPIYDKSGNEIIGILEMGVELNSLEKKIYAQFKTMAVKALLIISIMLFLMYEVLESLPLASSKDSSAEHRRAEMSLPFSYVHPLTFVIFLVFNLSSGFAPNYAEKMSGSLWNLPHGVSSVLPLSAAQIMLAVGPLLCSKLIAWIGIKRSFMIGAFWGVLGEVLSARAASIYTLFWGMSAAGLGAGFLFTAIHVYIASMEHPDDREAGFSAFTVASFIGINCGVMIGGVVAVNFSQSAVFYMGSFMWLIVLAAFMLIVKEGKRGAIPTEQATPTVSTPGGGILARRSSLAMLGFLFMLLFPYSLLSGFLYYLIPIFGGGVGLSESEISLVFVLYGVGVMSGSKLASIIRDTNPGNPRNLVAPVLSGVAAIVLFAVAHSTGAMFVSAFIIGCSNSAGGVFFPLYFTEISVRRNSASGTEMVIYDFIESLGYAGGPLVFGLILSSGNVTSAFIVLSASILAIFLVFYRGQARRLKSY
jgi:predicted MFS family arabinose efflux permease